MLKQYALIVLLVAAMYRPPSVTNLASTSGKIACESKCVGGTEISIELCVAECTNPTCYQKVFSDDRIDDIQKKKRDFKQCYIKEVTRKFQELKSREL
mmetsp:Transcript_33117/g.58263  ORF Transcript_33117/g.58263 Transcript_33117/m.58263 type:complete len:98 (+) Transcript_33117:52-345(+)